MHRFFASAQGRALMAAGVLTAALGGSMMTGCGSGDSGSPGIPNGVVTMAQVQHGRAIVTSVDCAGCHSRGKNDPSDPKWLDGFQTGDQNGSFNFGAVTTYAANITPDMTNGIGMHSDRQVYNALKFGLDPMNTPDVVITSTTPGVGNFPATPFYLAAPMPWTTIRNMSDDDIWAIVAYLKHGLKAVSNAVPASGDLTHDHWAGFYVAGNVGPFPLPAYPATNEQFMP